MMSVELITGSAWFSFVCADAPKAEELANN